MSRILLISANRVTTPYAVYPLGMAVIAAALKNAGHHAKQVDLLAGGGSTDGLIQIVDLYDPDYIGISIRNIDNVDSTVSGGNWYIEETRQLISQLRKMTSVPIILGGPAFSILPETILEYTKADYGIVGEGERAIIQLINDLKANLAESKVIHQKSPYLRKGQILSPCWDETLCQFYLAQSGLLNLHTKRGCPYQCAYCSYPQLEGSRLRPRPVEAVIEDIRHLTDLGKNRPIFFTDSVFNDKAGYYLTLAEEIIRSDLKIEWYGYFRPTGMGLKELRLLKRAGLSAMEIGSDGMADATLEGLNKQFSFESIEEIDRLCHSAQIPAAHFFMAGGPNETEQTVKEGLINIGRLNKSVVFLFSGIRILPNTLLHKQALMEEIVSPGDNLLKPRYYFSNKILPTRMNEILTTGFSVNPLHFFPPSQADAKASVLKRFGYKGLMWDRLIHYP